MLNFQFVIYPLLESFGSGGAYAAANSSAARPLCRISLGARAALEEFQPVPFSLQPLEPLSMSDCVRFCQTSVECWRKRVLSADKCPAKVTLSPSRSRVTWEDVRLALTAACHQLARFEGTPAFFTPRANLSIQFHRFNVQKWWIHATLSQDPGFHTLNAL